MSFLPGINAGIIRKNIGVLCFLMLLTVFNVNNTYALNDSYRLSGPSEIVMGEEFDVEILGAKETDRASWKVDRQGVIKIVDDTSRGNRATFLANRAGYGTITAYMGSWQEIFNVQVVKSIKPLIRPGWIFPAMTKTVRYLIF